MAEAGKSVPEELLEYYRKAKSQRNRIEHDWYMNLAFYVGDQWIFWNRGRIDRPRLEPWRVKFTDNRILPVVTSRVAKKVKNRPIFEATPGGSDESDLSASEIAEKVLRNDWNTLQLDHKHLQVEFWTEICGAGFWKIYWDQTKGDSAEFLYGPEGPIKSKNTPVRYDEAQQNGSYDILKKNMGDQLQVRPLAIGDVNVDVISPFEIFPDPLATSMDECEWIIEEKVRSKEYVKKVYDVDAKEDADVPVGIAESRMFPSSSVGTTETYKGVKVYEYFCRPNSTHGNGKWCVWINDKLVREKDGPTSPYAGWPYVMFTAGLVPGRFWPTAVTTQLRPPQTDLNKLQSQIRENAIRIGNPPLLEARHANIEWSGVPGERVKFDAQMPDSIPQFLQIPEIPIYVREEIDRIQNSITEISGLHEVSKAQVPPGITAASAINLLQEADDTRLAPEIQMMEKTLAEAGTKILKLRAKFMQDERIARLAGEDGDWDIFAYRGAMLENILNVEVQAGSAMPRSKAAKQAAMIEILQTALQYGVPIQPRTMRKFMRDYELGGLDRLFADIEQDEVQLNREHRKMYQGMQLLINDYDNDDLHIEGHEDEMKSARFERAPDNIRAAFLQHMQLHKERRMAAREAQLQSMLQQADASGTNLMLEPQAQTNFQRG